MAKSIAVRLDGESSSFSFARLERERLYGRKERQIVDADGKRCTSAWLSADGAALVPSGGLAMLYMDDNFNTVERSTLKEVDDHGIEMISQPSTLGVEQELVGPVAATNILNHAIHTVYILGTEAVGPKLTVALARGKIFSTVFNFRDDYHYQTLFLVGNEFGTFALIGSAVELTMVQRDTMPMAAIDITDNDELSDDLDFSMM